MVKLTVTWKTAEKVERISLPGWAKPIPAEGCAFSFKQSTQAAIELKVDRVSWKVHAIAVDVSAEVVLECSLAGGAS